MKAVLLTKLRKIIVTDFPNQTTIVNAVLKGIEEAKNNFLFWTNNRLYLSHGPQKMITIHVAQEIAKIKNAPEIFIDATIEDILRCSLEDREAFREYMQKNSIPQGVFSITLDERIEHKNDNDSVSRAIISIKNGIRNIKSEYTYEIERICKMLNTTKEDNSSLNFGLLAFYSDLSCTARKKLNVRIPLIINSFNEVVRKFPNLKSRFVNCKIYQIKSIGEWSIGAYIIERV